MYTLNSEAYLIISASGYYYYYVVLFGTPNRCAMICRLTKPAHIEANKEMADRAAHEVVRRSKRKRKGGRGNAVHVCVRRQIVRRRSRRM